MKTLPIRYLHDGLAEVIKYGCIMDKELFVMLEKIQSDEELLNHVDEIIEICCNIKARIVEHDEFDTGERMLLNFGHTLGHAVEKTFHFDRYSHGEGVGIGMVLLTRQSEELGLTERGTADRIAALLQKFQLPIAVDMRRDDFLQAIALDKKKRGSHLTLILLKKSGIVSCKTLRSMNCPGIFRKKRSMECLLYCCTVLSKYMKAFNVAVRYLICWSVCAS